MEAPPTPPPAVLQVISNKLLYNIVSCQVFYCIQSHLVYFPSGHQRISQPSIYLSYLMMDGGIIKVLHCSACIKLNKIQVAARNNKIHVHEDLLTYRSISMVNGKQADKFSQQHIACCLATYLNSSQNFRSSFLPYLTFPCPLPPENYERQFPAQIISLLCGAWNIHVRPLQSELLHIL